VSQKKGKKGKKARVAIETTEPVKTTTTEGLNNQETGFTKELKGIERTYTASTVIDSDTFKLEVEKMYRDISPDPKSPQIIPLEHCHMFHTYDSNGKSQTKSSAIGGHTHPMNVEYNTDGQIISCQCGPAIGLKNDNHTHRTTYIKSQKVKIRKHNEVMLEAMKRHDQAYNQ